MTGKGRSSKSPAPSSPPKPSRTDMILAMNDPYMQQIIDGTKTYEFRKYNMAGIKRIWFYRTAPHSAITHICPVEEAVTKTLDDGPLPEDGLGNREYNEKHADYEGYDYSYRIKEVYEINAEGGRGITWAMMRDEHAMKIAPRGESLFQHRCWNNTLWEASARFVKGTNQGSLHWTWRVRSFCYEWVENHQ